MEKRAAENLLEFLSDPENYDKEIVEEIVSEKMKRREAVRQRLLDILNRAAVITANNECSKIEEGIRKQEEFIKRVSEDTYFMSNAEARHSTGCQLQFRNGGEINEEEKKKIAERDKKAMEIFRRLRKGKDNI